VPRYRTHLESLSDYVLVSQDQPFVEHFLRQPAGQWLYSSVEGLDASLSLESIDCRLPLVEGWVSRRKGLNTLSASRGFKTGAVLAPR